MASEAPDTDAYVEFFAEQLTTAQYVVHITMAKKASKAYRHALEAAKTFDNVIVLDSGHLSSGMGLIVLEAAGCVEAGMGAEKIAAEVEQWKAKTQTSFIVDNTKYLMRTGRISARVNAICEGLMLHPVVCLKKSSMMVSSIFAGTRENVRRRYIRASLKSPELIDTKTVFITYAGLSKEELEWIAAEVRKYVVFENVIYQKASPAISTNCGPGCFGILYMRK